jgi:uncharacterized protein YycO
VILLRFVEGGSWDSKIIRWDTRCHYSHVECLDPAGASITYGAMLKGGVKKRLFGDAEYKGAINFTVVQVAATSVQQNAFYDFVFSQIGKPYDWRAIVSFGLGCREWRREDSWFCSELIVRAFEVAGMLQIPNDMPSYRITPRDAWMLVGVKSEIALEP